MNPKYISMTIEDYESDIIKAKNAGVIRLLSSVSDVFKRKGEQLAREFGEKCRDTRICTSPEINEFLTKLSEAVIDQNHWKLDFSFLDEPKYLDETSLEIKKNMAAILSKLEETKGGPFTE